MLFVEYQCFTLSPSRTGAIPLEKAKKGGPGPARSFKKFAK